MRRAVPATDPDRVRLPWSPAIAARPLGSWRSSPRAHEAQKGRFRRKLSFRMIMYIIVNVFFQIFILIQGSFGDIFRHRKRILLD